MCQEMAVAKEESSIDGVGVHHSPLHFLLLDLEFKLVVHLSTHVSTLGRHGVMYMNYSTLSLDNLLQAFWKKDEAENRPG